MSESTVALLKTAYPVLLAAALAVSRTLGVMLINPAFTRLGVTGLLRACIAGAIAVPIAPPILEQISQLQGLSTLSLVGLMIKEFAIGALIGFIFGIPFWAAETAGDIVDLQRGTTVAQIVDPTALSESNISATFLTLAMLAIFYAGGGFSMLADAIYRSYALWPAAKFEPVMTAGSGLALLKTLDRIMQMGVLLVAPIMIALLIADLMLGYLSRLAPQIHVFDLSLAVKNLLFTFLMAVYAIFLAPTMATELGGLQGVVEQLRSFAPAP